LARERADFFDTRVTGRQEVWQTLRGALEVLWEADAARYRARAESAGTTTGTSIGDTDEDDSDEFEETEGGGGGGGGAAASEQDDRTVALATAQSILLAADITLPTGDLAQGAYDALGNYYSLPEQVVSDPANVLYRPGADSGFGDTKADLAASDETVEEGGADDEEEAERRREEKGKGVLNVRDQIMVRARLSEGAFDVNISVGKGDNVRSIARRVADEAKVSRDGAFVARHLLFVPGWPTVTNVAFSSPRTERSV
jgi:hypothetical protein